MNRQYRILMWSITLAAVAGLQFPLTSCSPTSLAPGDAVDSIRASRHNAAPSFVLIGSPLPSRRAIGSPATLVINNHTNCKLGFSLKGPSPRQSWIESEHSETFKVPEGRYEYSADTRLCSGDVRPLYGEGAFFNSGRTYNLSIDQQDIMKGGEVIIENDTGAELQVEVGNIKRTIRVGQTTISLPEGTYTLTVTARCRNRTLRGRSNLEVAQDLVLQRKYSCITTIEPASPE